MPTDYKNNFNTKLTPSQEKQFTNWAKTRSKGKDPLADLEDYDLKGYWLNEEQSEGEHDESKENEGHLPDTYKKPNHPTFSNESIYHSKNTPGGEWKNKSFTPSINMLKTTSKLPNLMKYMKENEPDTKLQMPLGLKEKAITRRIKNASKLRE